MCFSDKFKCCISSAMKFRWHSQFIELEIWREVGRGEGGKQRETE